MWHIMLHVALEWALGPVIGGAWRLVLMGIVSILTNVRPASMIVPLTTCVLIWMRQYRVIILNIIVLIANRHGSKQHQVQLQVQVETTTRGQMTTITDTTTKITVEILALFVAVFLFCWFTLQSTVLIKIRTINKDLLNSFIVYAYLSSIKVWSYEFLL